MVTAATVQIVIETGIRASIHLGVIEFNSVFMQLWAGDALGPCPLYGKTTDLRY